MEEDDQSTEPSSSSASPSDGPITEVQPEERPHVLPPPAQSINGEIPWGRFRPIVPVVQSRGRVPRKVKRGCCDAELATKISIILMECAAVSFWVASWHAPAGQRSPELAIFMTVGVVAGIYGVVARKSWAIGVFMFIFCIVAFVVMALTLFGFGGRLSVCIISITIFLMCSMRRYKTQMEAEQRDQKFHRTVPTLVS